MRTITPLNLILRSNFLHRHLIDRELQTSFSSKNCNLGQRLSFHITFKGLAFWCCEVFWLLAQGDLENSLLFINFNIILNIRDEIGIALILSNKFNSKNMNKRLSSSGFWRSSKITNFCIVLDMQRHILEYLIN